MMNRLRDLLPRGGTAGRPGQVNWLRVVYLTNLCMIPGLYLVFISGMRLPPLVNLYLSDPLMMGLGYLLVFLIWLLIDFSIDLEEDWMEGIYRNSGMRWLDILAVLLAGLIGYMAYRLQIFDLPLWVVGSLVLVNGLIGSFQLRQIYRPDTLDAMGRAAQPAGMGAAQEDPPGLTPIE